MSNWFNSDPKLTPVGYAREVLSIVKADKLPIDPIEIAQKQGITIDEREFPDDQIEGFYMKHGNEGLIAINSLIDYEPRKRFTCAHELGHANIKGHSDIEHRCSKRDIFTFNSTNKKETEANEFASELLIPTHFFLEDVKRRKLSFNTLEELADEKYSTSLTSMAIRFVKDSPERCAVVLTEDGIVKWAVKSKSFRLEVKTRLQVSPNTFAWDFFNEGKKLDGKVERVLSNAWLNTRNPNGLVFESSKSYENYGSVLTLLLFE
ncbi:MAG: ImmA/IrrE family metallo-endopeptidase [Eubacteriales bacterium]